MIRAKHAAWLLALFTVEVFADDFAGGKDKPLWQPEVGDFWTYDVTLEVAKGTQLPAGVAGQKIEELEGKIRATYEQRAVYRGWQPIPDNERKAHAFYFSNGDQLGEIQYMLIADSLIQAVGSKQEGQQPKKAVILNTPIPIIDAQWKGGEFFPVIMDQKTGDKTVRMTRQFRAVGWENVETPAGTYDAMYIQVVGMNGKLEIKRGYWFAPGIGFIKEVKKYYLGEQIVLTQTKELKKTGRLELAE